MPRRIVTDEHIEIIRTAPPSETLATLAKRLGVSKATIAGYRKLFRHTQIQRRWTPDEVEYVIRHPAASAAAIARELKRTPNTVHWKRNQLVKSGMLTLDSEAIHQQAARAPKRNAISIYATTLLSEDQVQKLLELSLETGLRRAEILRLLVDMATAENIREQWNKSQTRG